MSKPENQESGKPARSPKPTAQFPSRLAPAKNVECVTPSAYAGMAGGPALRIQAPIYLGAPILARTPHSVFAGPYHRNVLGIERSNSVLIGPADQARVALLEMGATHLAFCKGLRETTRYAEIWPDGLAAQLNRDEIPDWLVPDDDLTETEGVVRLYRIKPE